MNQRLGLNNCSRKDKDRIFFQLHNRVCTSPSRPTLCYLRLNERVGNMNLYKTNMMGLKFRGKEIRRRLHHGVDTAKVPRRLQSNIEIVLGSNHILGQTRDSVCTSAEGVVVHLGDATAVGTNGAGIAAVTAICVPETWWRSKVERGEGARLAEGVTMGKGKLFENKSFMRHAYGVGSAARSSKLWTSGLCMATAGLKGLLTPIGLSGARPSWVSRCVVGGAKSSELRKSMSLPASLLGVGREVRGAGGGRFFFGCGGR